MKRKRKYLKFTDQDRVNLKNALYNLTPHSGASADYCEGMVLGIVALGMAQGLEFDQALDLVAEHFPDGGRVIAPPSWIEGFKRMLAERKK